LVAFDQDPDAARQAEQLRAEHPAAAFTFIASNFRHLAAGLAANGIDGLDGLLADLGVSSYQFDTPARGFSTRFDGPLDMRMNPTIGLSAADVVREYAETDLHRIFGMYGEITNARTLARAVVEARAAGQPLDTVAAFKRAIAGCVMPRGKENKYYAQVFQALRIEVNDEMGALTDLLTQAAAVLRPGGRLVVMSYHSLEDRLVKNILQHGKPWGDAEKDLYGNPVGVTFRPLTRKPVEADAAEVAHNPRARSSKLRIGERIAALNTAVFGDSQRGGKRA
jgi:16S rRNA (cytosine1402-N4)-methyltransferase